MPDMLVLQYGNRTIKGHSDKTLWSAGWNTGPGATTPPIQILGSDATQSFPVEDLKAVFFVKSFAGKSHEDLRFHDHLPAVECLWVRITFLDGEVIEGLVQNAFTFIRDPGFLISPIDPEGNNLLVYVVKTQLQNFEVLGLRPTRTQIF